MVSVDEFIAGLTQSGLMAAEEVHAFQVSLPPTGEAPSVKMLATELVRRGQMTKYQVGRIATGRAKGLVLGKYIIQDKIGEGGMGEVFVAEHRRMKRPVVVKVLPESAMASEDSVRRFQREVEAAAQLSHPNIVTAFDADEANGVHFLVMEHVDGQPLGELAERQGPLAIDLALSCALQAALGLEYAHATGIIHRDIKPNNLLVDKTGAVKILDMGLARFEDARGTISVPDDGLTKQNQIIGTVEYMSPEQVDDSANVDGRSDVYSLGCTLYRLLAGRPPYQGDTLVKTLLAHRTEPVPSIGDMRADAPDWLDGVLHRMLAKLPSDRYQSMTELIRDLETHLESLGVVVAKLQTPVAPTKSNEPDTATLNVPPTKLFERGSNAATLSDREAETLATPPQRSAPAVGIDLGTTFSAIAYIDDAGRPQVLSNQEGDQTTPSVVLIEDGDVVVGKEAAKAMATDMHNIAECAKRDLGMQLFHQEIGGELFPPEVIQAWILKKVSSDAQRQIGTFTKAVVTVPAYFDEVRRKATQDAGYVAGIEVIDIINEPTAAALAFGYKQGRLNPGAGDDEPKRVLVYDLGGGTFDVTIMEIGAGEFVTLATDGDVQLGGRDWDQRLVDYTAEQFIRKHGIDPREDPNTLGRLLRECEDAKRTLSTRQKASVACDFQGRAERFEVTRKFFEEITQDLLERTAFTTRQTLQSAGLSWDDIEHVLTVGGSTRMPAVVGMLTTLAGQVPDDTLSPDEAVAQGAAIHAGFVLDRLDGRQPQARVRNVNSHSLGIVGTDPKTKRKQTAVLIPRNTPLPAKAKRVFTTLKAGQRSVVANIVEGESRDPTACMSIGKCTVRNLPKALPAGTPIEVRFQYEENGRLRIAVNVSGVDNQATHEISRENNLARADLDAWRTKVAGL
ncbi:MAG: Hsp70 family protein [Planctomycetes bacterium]|nr:Hsp70 family protein [Planctomycetota bacterium]